MRRHAASAGTGAHASHDHGSDPGGTPGAGEGWPEGAQRALLTFRVQEHVDYARRVPERLSALVPMRVDGVKQHLFRPGFSKGRWRINDRVFSPDEPGVDIARDTPESSLLRNDPSSMPHAMHLHGTQFQVLERETSPDELQPLATHSNQRLATHLGWKDTVLVWPGESVGIGVRFALPFPGPQTYFLHCHNLEHEDGGMMLGVRVA